MKWFGLVLGCLLAARAVAAPEDSCKGTLYLTLDTGSMVSAETIANTLKRHHIKATFFIANEPTWRKDHALDDSWGDFWRARVAEGHHFGSHTWRHWYFRKDLPDGKVAYVGPDGDRDALDKDGVCEELGRVDRRFADLTGRHLDPLWRAPGGHVTPRSLKWAKACGFARHVGWAPAGFLGDELPSDQYPNDLLLKRALANIHDGDILMMHLGIRSRKDPFVKVFEPLIQGLQDKGFCFATLP
jgi:peptidoglycan/xylan/chitin deacetylase (PgdA/CDA1 family)